MKTRNFVCFIILIYIHLAVNVVVGIVYFVNDLLNISMFLFLLSDRDVR